MSSIDVRITGRPTDIAFKIDADSVRTTLMAIMREHPEWAAALGDENGAVGETVSIAVNGVTIDPKAETALNDGDVLAIQLFPAMDVFAAEPDSSAIQSKLEAEILRLHRKNAEQATLISKLGDAIRKFRQLNIDFSKSPGQPGHYLRTNGIEPHPGNFLDYAFHNDGDAIIAAMQQEFSHVTLVGPKQITAKYSSLIAPPGTVSTLDWSPEDADYPSFEGQAVLCVVPKNFAEWAAVSSYVEKMAGRLMPLWQPILRYGLFKDLMRVFEYNVTEFDELLRLYTTRDRGESTVGGLGHRPMEDIDALYEIFPLDGKSVVELGPSDGNHTTALLSLGAGPMTLVEGRGENVVKLLVAKWVMGWEQVEIHYDNFQLPGSWAGRKYDLVYAHGVYYHCQNPLIFLDMLMKLGDSIFVGGWCATDAKPPTSWTNVDYGGHGYRLKPFPESHHFLSGLADTSWMMDADEMIAFFERRGFTVDVISRVSGLDSLGDVFVRLLARR